MTKQDALHVVERGRLEIQGGPQMTRNPGQPPNPLYQIHWQSALAMRARGATYQQITDAYGGNKSSWCYKMNADPKRRARAPYQTGSDSRTGPPPPEVTITWRKCLGASDGCGDFAARVRKPGLVASTGRGHRMCKVCRARAAEWRAGAFL